MGLPKVYYCELCNKNYSCRQSLYKHNKTFHTKKPPNNSPEPPNNSDHPPNNDNMKPTKSISIEYKCEFCNKTFSRKDNLTKHINLNRCKKKNDIITSLQKENEELKINFQKEINDLKDQIKELMNKNCKIHYKTLQKINNQQNIQNQNNIQNNINIIGFNKENLIELFSEKEKLKILGKKFNSLNYLIEYTHFNSKYPQLKNIKITNLKDNVAYKYDNKMNKFIATTKDELINDLVISRMADIDEFQTEVFDKLKPKEQQIVKKMLDDFYNDEIKYSDDKKDEIKFIIYNNSENN